MDTPIFLTDGLVWCNSMDVVPVCHTEYRVVCDAVNLPNALVSNGLFLQPWTVCSDQRSDPTDTTDRTEVSSKGCVGYTLADEMRSSG